MSLEKYRQVLLALFVIIVYMHSIWFLIGMDPPDQVSNIYNLIKYCYTSYINPGDTELKTFSDDHDNTILYSDNLIFVIPHKISELINF